MAEKKRKITKKGQKDIRRECTERHREMEENADRCKESRESKEESRLGIRRKIAKNPQKNV